MNSDIDTKKHHLTCELIAINTTLPYIVQPFCLFIYMPFKKKVFYTFEPVCLCSRRFTLTFSILSNMID